MSMEPEVTKGPSAADPLDAKAEPIKTLPVETVPVETMIAQIVFTLIFGAAVFPISYFIGMGQTLREHTLSHGIAEYFTAGDYIFSAWGCILPYTGIMVTAGFSFAVPFLALYFLSLARKKPVGIVEEAIAWSVCALSIYVFLIANRLANAFEPRIFPTANLWWALLGMTLLSYLVSLPYRYFFCRIRWKSHSIDLDPDRIVCATQMRPTSVADCILYSAIIVLPLIVLIIMILGFDHIAHFHHMSRAILASIVSALISLFVWVESSGLATVFGIRTLVFSPRTLELTRFRRPSMIFSSDRIRRIREASPVHALLFEIATLRYSARRLWNFPRTCWGYSILARAFVIECDEFSFVYRPSDPDQFLEGCKLLEKPVELLQQPGAQGRKDSPTFEGEPPHCLLCGTSLTNVDAVIPGIALCRGCLSNGSQSPKLRMVLRPPGRFVRDRLTWLFGRTLFGALIGVSIGAAYGVVSGGVILCTIIFAVIGALAGFSSIILNFNAVVYRGFDIWKHDIIQNLGLIPNVEQEFALVIFTPTKPSLRNFRLPMEIGLFACNESGLTFIGSDGTRLAIPVAEIAATGIGKHSALFNNALRVDLKTGESRYFAFRERLTLKENRALAEAAAARLRVARQEGPP